MNEKKQTVTQVTTRKKETVVYIGATIERVVVSNTIFNNGLPQELQKKIEENPFLQALVVQVENLAEKRKELRTRDSSLATLYEMSKKL